MSARDLAATVRLVALARETTRGRHPHQDCVATAATVDALADALEAAEARALRAEEAMRQIADAVRRLKSVDDGMENPLRHPFLDEVYVALAAAAADTDVRDCKCGPDDYRMDCTSPECDCPPVANAGADTAPPEDT